MTEQFEEYLRNNNHSENTILAYLYSYKLYFAMHDEINQKNLREYKTYLIESYKIKTANVRIQGMNAYLDFIDKPKWKMPSVKIQQKTYLENVISMADYEYLKTCLIKDNEVYWYFTIRFMAATGARISELLEFKIEHVKIGYIDIYSKGGKTRRIYIPKALQSDALTWFEEINRNSGFIFLNKKGNRITTRGISSQLKIFAKRYEINDSVVYPHSFRHRFAKNFLEKCSDISLLADLMGHDSIETTRIYLRKSSTEQQTIVDDIVDW